MSQDHQPEAPPDAPPAGGDMPPRDPALQAALDELRGGAPPPPATPVAHVVPQPAAPFQAAPSFAQPVAPQGPPPPQFGVPFRAGVGSGIANITATLEGPNGAPVRMDQLPPAAFPFQQQHQPLAAHPFGGGQMQHMAAQPMPGRPGRGMQMQMSISGGEASAPPALPAQFASAGQYSPEEEHWRQRLGIARLEALVLSLYGENEKLQSMILTGRRG